ncbi:Gfo/Idh/MocA family oxidoreductase [Cellulomonas marina]|uniref:Predicted dehydrogenase n=1 Tax=Cellulomonas marina TaxID=988821 RepID=A0A1I0W0I8_9CELL|nr:Gfo/Idh/MocA family oxidoreductase [Cellulomonas marina]GIG27451.1 oxidoreductase [Cellulomonas marina]SFA81653.1 Predicted dehydrogenase [Cellulomonas marina]
MTSGMTDGTDPVAGADAPLRIGVVGYGGAGRGIHARLARAAGQHVTHVVTRHRSDQVHEDWPDATVVPDLDALLGSAGRLDLVVVASPTGDHAAHVAAALQAGVHVMTDKPLATTTAEATALASAGAEAGGRLTVFQNRRWDGEQLTLRRLLDEGALGRVHRFERRWERYRPVPQDRWKENDPRSGGLLLDLGAHLVDAAVQLFGPVEQVVAELRALTTPAVDDVFLALRHRAPEGGGPAVVSHLQAGSLVGAPGPRTRVLGERGAYLVTRFEGEPTPFEALDEALGAGTGTGTGTGTGDGSGAGDLGLEHEGWLVRGAERTPVPRAPGGHVDLYHAVERWVRGTGPVPVDPWDAVATARVLDAAVVSAGEDRPVRLSPEAR